LRGTEHERQRLSLNRLIHGANKTWHGIRLNQPDWSDHSRSVAFTAEIRKEKLLFHLILNAHCEPLDFELPPLARSAGNSWRRWIDTALASPDDIVPWEQAPAVPGLIYRAEARSVVALYAAAVAGRPQARQQGEGAGQIAIKDCASTKPAAQPPGRFLAATCSPQA
jgi:glycogen operon protein